MTRSAEAAVALKSGEPATDEHAPEIQAYGQLVRMPIALSEHVRRESVENLNQLLADTITLRDLYKKHHWQVSGPAFYQCHLLFDPTHTHEIPTTDGEPNRTGASKPFVAASSGHGHAASLDAVAGGEFLDDHLRLRE